jgi:histidinol-phosphate phosphatase family protein
MSSAPWLFLDRDGTLNVDTGYVREAQTLTWLPGVIEALVDLAGRGWKFAVVSNQSGLARGYMTWPDLWAIEQRMQGDLRAVGVQIQDWAYCAHGPQEHCPCRKPGAALLEELIARHQVDVSRSWMVGDALRDVEAGLQVGLNVAGVLTGKEPQLWQGAEVPVVRDLKQWAEVYG